MLATLLKGVGPFELFQSISNFTKNNNGVNKAVKLAFCESKLKIKTIINNPDLDAIFPQ